ncbi:alanine racemase [Rhodovibrionaceae bacterium A322]
MWSAIETPRLILDKTRLETNAAAFQARARDMDIRLRPHLKTSKSARVARTALAGTCTGVTVSTLREAEYFAQEGFTDILYAVGITPNKFAHVKRLIEQQKADLLLLTDSLVVAQAAAEFAERENCPLSFLIEVDCGEHRGGLPSDCEELLQIARVLEASPAITFKGVMTHAGHSYGTDDIAEVKKIAEKERLTAVLAAARLSHIGISSEIVSAGSTPTFLFAESFDGLTEMRCGVYLFYDLAQYSRNICSLEDIALSVLATVIGHNRQGQSLVVDAGAFALTKDLGANRFLPDAGYGLLCDPDTMEPLGKLAVNIVHQEHGTVAVPDDSWFDCLPIGSQVRILPNHACATASAYSDYLVIEGSDVIGSWPRVNGW